MAAPIRPEHLTLRAYQVGFGDCFLLSFHYPARGAKPAFDRHVLIDFGSTAGPKNAPSDYLERVANDIANQCNGKLHAVVATHRHADHINGFTRRADGKGSGDIIRKLNPDVVVQSWTEDPDAQRDALSPTAAHDPGAAQLRALASMQVFAAALLREADELKGRLGVRRLAQLRFLGEDGIHNPDAVKNLMTMGKKQFYVYHGSRSGLEKVLPGVKCHVLGPPTFKQASAIRKQRAKDEDEFWHLQAGAGAHFTSSGTRLFPRAAAYPKGQNPPYARWIIPRMLTMRAEQLLEIVRILDEQMNNTSVILLFETAQRKLLFPGDAQLENWMYALKESPRATQICQLLSAVDLYKVGHHGSLNATPKTLWGLFKKRGPKTKPGRLQTVISTKEGKHGDASSDTEVPRETLVQALIADSDYHSTQSVTAAKLKLTITGIPL